MAEPKLTVEVEEKDVDIHEADVINEEQQHEEVEFEINKDSVKEVKEEEPVAENKSEDELEEYSEGVKKRISQLTYKYREAERQKEEAVKYAENILKENSTLKSNLKNSDTTLVNEAENRIQSQLEAAKKRYKLAYENGDAEEMADANADIGKLSAEATSIGQVKKRLDSQPEAEENIKIPDLNNDEQNQQPPDPKAQEWAAKNEWFGKDSIMTYAVFGIHKDLFDLGYDLKSNEYYEEIDRRMKDAFPQKFSSDSTDANVNVKPKVAAPTRTASNKASRKVRLTPSQVAIAKRLGVSLEDYAKHVKVGE
jgi:chromosome segregation ATPase